MYCNEKHQKHTISYYHYLLKMNLFSQVLKKCYVIKKIPIKLAEKQQRKQGKER